MKKIKFIFLASLLILLLFAAFYNGLVVKTYIVSSDKIAAGETIRVVLIADLHNHIYSDNQSKIIALIQEQNPDIIALAGDIADDQLPILGTELFLAGIQGLAPVYYVSGNHEFWSDDIDNIKNTIRKYDVKILEHNYEQVKVRNSNIIMGGVDDPEIVKYEKPGFDWEGEMQSAFSDFQEFPQFKILLAHRPELIELYKGYDFDLVLSGHSHGGQVRIPFILNGLYAPNQGWFPQYAGGVYTHNSLTHIVSRGVSYNPRLPRIFNPPEVVLVQIKGI